MWHVDDSKISHKEELVVRDIINKIEDKFGDIKAVCGPEQEFLGMKIVCRNDGNFSIDVKAHLQKAYNEFDEDLGKATSPAKNGLFNIDPDSPAVAELTRRRFHKIAQLLLCVACRGRKDLLPAIAFLT